MKIKLSKIKNNKKAMELSLQTIVIFILLMITFIVVIYFFVHHYGNNSGTIIDVGNSAIDTAKNYK